MKKKKHEIRLKFSQHKTPPGSGLADCHLKKPIQLNRLVWTKSSRKNGSGYCFKSKVSTAAEARNFHSTLVTSQWGKSKTRSKNSKSSSSKTQCTDQVTPETAKEIMLAKMCEAGNVHNVPSQLLGTWCFVILVGEHLHQDPCRTLWEKIIAVQIAHVNPACYNGWLIYRFSQA